MKPRLFLSHAAGDKPFIHRLASDLRAARIECWVDEWEIPPGTSFRRKIFEEGLPECDLFFIYLTPTAIESYWVTKELDAAFILDAASQGGYLVPFVDADATRSRLSTDLQSLQSPVLNEGSYVRPIAQLVARAWEFVGRREIDLLRRQGELEAQAARGRVIELEDAVRSLRLAQPDGVETALAALETISYDVGLGQLSLTGILRSLHVLVAGGMSQDSLALRIFELAQIHFKSEASWSMAENTALRMIGNLNLLGMVVVTMHRETIPVRGGLQVGFQPPQDPVVKDLRSFVLTELGRRVINSLLTT